MSNQTENVVINESVMNLVAGFQEAVKVKEALAKTGSDFSDQKWATANTIKKLHPKRLSLIVSEIIEETESTKTFRFIKNTQAEDQKLPPFQAGQYINLFVNIEGVETARPYAVSSSPKSRDYYDLTVKRVEGGFVTNYLLDKVAVGEEFSSTGPMGSFYHNPVFHGQDLVFLAGGSGIAPALSMIKDVLEREQGFRFHFIYASSYVHDVIFEKQLRELAENYENFILTEMISRPPEGFEGITGHVTKERLVEILGSIEDKMFYVCGPTPFNNFCQEQLRLLNVPSRFVRIEANGPPKHPEKLAGWPSEVTATDEVTITVKGKGSFIARVDEPLLNSLERNGYGTENACRSGECSLCRVKLVSGSVFNPTEAHLRKSDYQFGWIHACVAFPIEDIEILL
tara:strand:- start:601 stop:1797 length:1197 start_codon:yes stop_codon:yes gene_type:complete